MPRPTPCLIAALALSCSAFATNASAEATPRPQPADAQPAKPAPAKIPAARAAAPANDALPTSDEIQQLFTEGKYKETLQRLNRVLALKGDAAAAFDRHEMLALKAETHLRLKDANGAAAAFTLAAKEAPDEKAAAVDRANALVVKRSKNLSFTPAAPKGGAGKAGPIDITEPEQRKKAFAAMLAEHKEELAPKLKSAKGAKALPPIAEALQAAGGMRVLELAATGDDAETRATVKELADRARKMMADAVADLAKAADDIELAANDLREVMTPVRSPLGGRPMMELNYRKRGLDTPMTRELKQIIADCKKIVPAARELAEALGDAGGEEFKAIGKDAEAAGNKAHEVLTADYENSYTQSPRSRRDRTRRDGVPRGGSGAGRVQRDPEPREMGQRDSAPRGGGQRDPEKRDPAGPGAGQQ